MTTTPDAAACDCGVDHGDSACPLDQAASAAEAHAIRHERWQSRDTR